METSLWEKIANVRGVKEYFRDSRTQITTPLDLSIAKAQNALSSRLSILSIRCFRASCLCIANLTSSPRGRRGLFRCADATYCDGLAESSCYSPFSVYHQVVR